MKARPGRRPCITAERTTVTWSPSLTLTSRDGSKRKPRRLIVPTSGLDCATPALWISGSGSVMRSSPIRTGPHLDRRMSVTCLEPWTEKDNISGSVSMIMRSIISSAPSFKTFDFHLLTLFGCVFFLNNFILLLFHCFIQF